MRADNRPFQSPHKPQVSLQRSIDSRQKKPKSILEALFGFKLDRAFVMELVKKDESD